MTQRKAFVQKVMELSNMRTGVMKEEETLCSIDPLPFSDAFKVSMKGVEFLFDEMDAIVKWWREFSEKEVEVKNGDD